MPTFFAKSRAGWRFANHAVSHVRHGGDRHAQARVGGELGEDSGHVVGGGQQVVVEVLLEKLGGVVVVLDGLLRVDLHDDVVLARGEHVATVHQEGADVAAAVGGDDAHVGVHASFLGARFDEGFVLLVRGCGHQVVAGGQDAQAVEDLGGHGGVEDVGDGDDLEGGCRVQGGLVGARRDDGGQARVRHEITRTRGARQVREDQVGVVAGPAD